MAITTLNLRAINRSDTASSGQVITATSATAADFQDSSGGLQGLDMWRVTADITANAQPISSNWERVDTGNFTGIGTAFSAPSSGIWTFRQLVFGKLFLKFI